MRLRAALVNELLDWRGVPIILGRGKPHRITLTEILRDLAPLNEGRDTRRPDHLRQPVGPLQASLRPGRESGLPENGDKELIKALRG